MQINFINKIDDLKKFYIKNNEFLHQAKNTTPFHQREWILGWWQEYAKDKDTIFSIIIKDESQVIAFVPLYIRRDKTLMFLGTGEDQSIEACPEYLDVIYSPSLTSEQVNELIIVISAYLKKNQSKWKQALFINALEHSIIMAISVNVTPKISRSVDVGAQHKVLIKKNIHNYIDSLSSKSFRKKLTKLNRLLAEENAITVEHLFEPESMSFYVEKLISLHNNSWKEKMGVGAFSAEEFRRFHKSLMLEGGDTSLTIVKIDKHVVAIGYYFSLNKVCHYYQSGIDHSIDNKFAPGHLMHLARIRYCIDKNYNYYDFMRGTNSASYKKKYSPIQVPMFNITVNKYNLTWLLNSIKSIIKRIPLGSVGLRRFFCRYFLGVYKRQSLCHVVVKDNRLQTTHSD
jgi:hypothetical protein